MSSMQSPEVEAESTPKRPASEPSVSLEELIRQQGVKPIHDLDALGALWPGFAPQRHIATTNDERASSRRARQTPPVNEGPGAALEGGHP